MSNYCGGSLVKWFSISLLLCQVLSLPKAVPDENPIRKIFSESKRDISSLAGEPVVPLLRSPLFNPYFMYPPFIPGRPFSYPPLTPSDILLNRFAKATPTTISPSGVTIFRPPYPTMLSAYFKAKKDEFMSRMFEKLKNDTMNFGPSVRSAPMPEDSDPTKPTIDASFFLKKKSEFLETLFKTLNLTAQPNITDTQTVNTTDATTTTPKPTIVPPDFWFPFAKLTKPTKAPKPTKPPKAKKILKDALDTILLQSLLLDMGVDPKDASLNKRTTAAMALSKKTKSKKIKPEEDYTEFYSPPKINPTLYSAKASECLNKLFKILNKTDDEELESYVQPKAPAFPKNLWTQPSETEYSSKLDELLDLLIKSLNATDVSSEKFEKGEKVKSKPGKKISKRSTFLDELLHRVTTTPPPSTTPSEPNLPAEDVSIFDDPDCDFAKIFKACCSDGKCFGSLKGYRRSARSLIFKPFGSGYWIPQYLYAAKMGMYLDKLMDTINTAAASEVESESANADGIKRSVPAGDAGTSGMPSKNAALNLIIAELTELKDDLVDAFADGIKAQKDATPTQKPFGPGAKSFKKPFWGPKAFPTIDPLAPIQKRIDILNDVFDKLTKVEKTLIFTEEPEYDPKLIANLTEILSASSPKSKTGKFPAKLTPKISAVDTDSPEFFLTKTREYLKSLYSSKMDGSDD